jgi:hypothetical protein
MSWITASQVRAERVPNISTTAYSDTNLNLVITRAEADIKASGGKYQDIMNGHIYGEILNLGTAGIGNKRVKAIGNETSARLNYGYIVASSYFIFKNPSEYQNYRNIRGDEGQLLVLTTDYSINTTTGVITLVKTLNTGDQLTATYDTTFDDTNNKVPQVLRELAKSLTAYYTLVNLYGENFPSSASEVVNQYKEAMNILKLLREGQFPIPEFDAIQLVELEEFSDSKGEIGSSKIMRR